MTTLFHRFYDRFLYHSARAHRGTKLAFIPHEQNGYHPNALRPSALKIYSIILITAKIALTGFLYAAYPSEGQFAELTVKKMNELTNTSRVENGLATLRMNSVLSKAALA